VRAERAFLAALGGGCETPAGCLARMEAGRLLLEAVVVSGGAAMRTSSAGPAQCAEEIGREAAARLLSSGAAR
jgi:hydroxymethylbilane synthase